MVLGDAGDLSGSPGSSCFARSLDKSELSWHHPSSRCGSGLRRLVRGNQTGREGDEKDLIELHMCTMGSAASAFGIAPSNGIGQQVPVHGPWTYGNHCGAGGMGPDVNSTDAACHVHDDCFDAIHLTADQYTSGQASPAQVQGAAACNQQLCNSVLNVNRGSGVPLSQRWAGAEIILFFSLTGPKGAQCHGF